MDTLMAASALC